MNKVLIADNVSNAVFGVFDKYKIELGYSRNVHVYGKGSSGLADNRHAWT